MCQDKDLFSIQLKFSVKEIDRINRIWYNMNGWGSPEKVGEMDSPEINKIISKLIEDHYIEKCVKEE